MQTQEESVKYKYLPLAATLALVLAMAPLCLTHQLFAQGTITIGLQIAAGLLMLWARVVFGIRSFHAAANTTSGKLVTNGPYKYMRNPIYTAILLFAWTGIISHASPVSILLGGCVTAAILVRIFCEEQFLQVAYPAYATYRQQTKRLIPFVC